MAQIRCKTGDTFNLSATYTDGENPIDLTGYTIACQLRRATGRGPLIHDFDAEGGITITNAAAGQYQISAPPADTQDWVVGDAVLDIEYTDGSGTVRSTENIDVEILQDVTHG